MSNEEKILSMLGALTEDVAGMKVHMGSIDQRLDSVDQRLDSVDQRLDSVDQRLDSVDQRLDRIEEDIVEIKEDVAVTRAVTNSLLDWADIVGDTARVPLKDYA